MSQCGTVLRWLGATSELFIPATHWLCVQLGFTGRSPIRVTHTIIEKIHRRCFCLHVGVSSGINVGVLLLLQINNTEIISKNCCFSKVGGQNALPSLLVRENQSWSPNKDEKVPVPPVNLLSRQVFFFLVFLEQKIETIFLYLLLMTKRTQLMELLIWSFVLKVFTLLC